MFIYQFHLLTTTSTFFSPSQIQQSLRQIVEIAGFDILNFTLKYLPKPLYHRHQKKLIIVTIPKFHKPIQKITDLSVSSAHRKILEKLFRDIIITYHSEDFQTLFSLNFASNAQLLTTSSPTSSIAFKSTRTVMQYCWTYRRFSTRCWLVGKNCEVETIYITIRKPTKTITQWETINLVVSRFPKQKSVICRAVLNIQWVSIPSIVVLFLDRLNVLRFHSDNSIKNSDSLSDIWEFTLQIFFLYAGRFKQIDVFVRNPHCLSSRFQLNFKVR